MLLSVSRTTWKRAACFGDAGIADSCHACASCNETDRVGRYCARSLWYRFQGTISVCAATSYENQESESYAHCSVPWSLRRLSCFCCERNVCYVTKTDIDRASDRLVSDKIRFRAICAKHGAMNTCSESMAAALEPMEHRCVADTSETAGSIMDGDMVMIAIWRVPFPSQQLSRLWGMHLSQESRVPAHPRSTTVPRL